MVTYTSEIEGTEIKTLSTAKYPSHNLSFYHDGFMPLSDEIFPVPGILC